MPSRKASDGEYRDIAHPINSTTREQLQNLILEKYKEESKSHLWNSMPKMTPVYIVMSLRLIFS